MSDSDSKANTQGKSHKPADKGVSDDHGHKPEPPGDDDAVIALDPDKSPTLNDYVASFIARFDASGDSAVALDEMLAALDPDAVHPGFDKHVGQLFAEMDANGDDLLDEAELTAVMGRLDAQNNGKPDGVSGRLHAATVQLVNLALRPGDDQDDDDDDDDEGTDDDIDDADDTDDADDGDEDAMEPVSLTGFVDRIMARFDADASHGVTLAEMLAVLDPERAHPGFDKHVGKIFAAIDADADQLLSLAELTSAIGRLDREQEGRPEDVPGCLHAATVQLVGLALENRGQHDDEG